MNIAFIKKTALAFLLATMITACGKSEQIDTSEVVVGNQSEVKKTYGKFTPKQKKQFDKANQYVEKQDTDSAIKTLTPLAEEGQSDSQNALAFIYIKQNKVVEAKQWFEKAAQQNHPEAQNNLGMIYLQGIGVAPDYAKARQYFEQAATQNSILAQNNLGMMYMQGTGVETNMARAKDYLTRAAEQGSSLAQYNVAMIYLNGLGGEPVDKEQAKKYLQMAAKQGDLDAQSQLNLLK